MLRLAFTQLLCLIWSVLCTGLVYECNFDGLKLKEGLEQNLSSSIALLTFARQLPLSRALSHSCIVRTDRKESFLHVKAKTYGETRGALHVAVYDADENSLGQLDISVTGSWRKMSTCPQKSGQSYLVQFTGTPNVSYTAEIYDDVPNVTIGKEVSFDLSTQSPSQIFQFKPMKGISKTQLDITVESDSMTSAYLKVSHTCKEVAANDIKYLNYNGGSLRLTFAEKGRITLSKASSPPLKDSGSAWFIGIALKDDSDVANVTKPVRLTLTKSFDYDYSRPFYFLIGTSFFGGIVVALWALLCFREPYILAHEDSLIADNTTASFSTSGTGFKANLKSLLSSCWRNGGESDELRPLVRGSRDRTPLTWKEIGRAMKNVLFHHWFSKGPKTFSYTTCIVGFVLLVGAFQFVFEDWHLMIQEGDRDKCFYNDLCYRVSGYDIPFNLMISNLAYMIHGFILWWSVWIMEAELLAWCQRIERSNRLKSPRLPTSQVELPKHVLKCPNINAHLASMSVPPLLTTPEESILLHAKAHKKKYTFSIGYAFAWGLIFEGCFSMLYHLCPTKLTFQFDAAFMFVISGLIVLSLYNGISFKECAHGRRIQQPVEASNFFLYFIVPLYVFNYFGSLYYSNTESLSVGMQIVFVLCLVAYYIIMFSWAGVKLFYNISRWGDFKRCDVLTKAVIFIVILALASIALPVLFKTNFPNIFLFTCILACLLAIMGKVVIKFWQSERSHWTVKKVAFRIFQGSYVLVTLGVMGTAVWIFSMKATTDKVQPPEISRDLNHACAVVGFFDYHDLWHILSSFALLMGAYLVLYISE